MLKLTADLGLLHETADQVVAAAVLLQEDLQGQVAAEVGVVAPEHGTHAAAVDLAEKPVSAGDTGRG